MPTRKNSVTAKVTPKTATATKAEGKSLKAPKTGKMETTFRANL